MKDMHPVLARLIEAADNCEPLDNMEPILGTVARQLAAALQFIGSMNSKPAGLIMHTIESELDEIEVTEGDQ